MTVESSPNAMAAAAQPTDVPARAPRNIVLLSDGTGNSRGKVHLTNVWRVYEALDLKDPPDLGVPRQFAFYDDGVGSSAFKPLAILGGALGWGLARNVQDLYAFLCRMYRPDAPADQRDRIYAFGFSRGAFTIRVLVGLIRSQGIVRYQGDEAELDRLVSAAYRAYRTRYRLKFIHYVGVLRWLRDLLITGWALLHGKLPYADIARITARDKNGTAVPDRLQPLRHRLIRIAAALHRKPLDPAAQPGNVQNVRIEFLGLWDTVDAYGVPVDELGVVINNFIWPFQMPDARLNPNVACARHALALDDERNTFHPKLWENDDLQPDRIQQVWFAGMHSDVGGGYADKGLSHVSLKWIVDAASRCQLRFVPSTLAAQEALSDENGPMNDSRRGIAGYYRYNPRRLTPLLTRCRIARPIVHESVFRRIRAGQDAYAPIVLPADFDVLPMAGGTPVDGATYLQTGPQQRLAYGRQIEAVYNRVWLRRVIYFATLLLTVLLLVRPLTSDKADTCTSRWCAVSPAIRALDAVLPSQAAHWVQWWANRPGTFLALVLALGLGLAAGRSVQRSIFDTMRRIWYAVAATRPTAIGQPLPPAACTTGLCHTLFRLRTSGPYQAAFKAIKHVVLPTTLGLALAAAVLMLVNGALFAMAAAGGQVCHGTAAAALSAVAEAPRRLTLRTRELCLGTGLQLERGASYELVLVAGPPGAGWPWRDGPRLAADLRGVPAQQTPWTHRVFALLKREQAQPWLQPMARIGSQGADVYALRPDPSQPLGEPLRVLRSRFVARSGGELFLYVNDAIGPPGRWALFQDNNCGTAAGTIRRLPPSDTAPVPSDDAWPGAADEPACPATP